MDHYRQPQYFSDFHCVGGECPVSCCDGWNVAWLPDEYSRLKTAPAEGDLKTRIEGSFAEEKDMFIIKMCDDGRCPFHNRETGLCDIQREVGEQYFGVTCRTYPRRYFKREDVIFRACRTSCPAVVELLINERNACRLETLAAHDADKLDIKSVATDSVGRVKKSPYLKYRNEILEFYSELFTGRSEIGSSVVIGALAAKKISDAALGGGEGQIPRIIDDYRKQSRSPAVMRSIDEIKPNLRVKFLIVNNLIYEYFGWKKGDIDISRLHDGQAVVPERYAQGEENFRKAFEGREYALKNIAVNMFIDIFMLMNYTAVPFFDLYTYFAACLSVLQVFACAIGYESDSVEKELVRVTSVLNRAISHNINRAGEVLENLKSTGIVSAAHIAVLVK